MRAGVFVILIVGGVGSAAFWLLWQLVIRPYAVYSGMILPTAYDYVVRGWKAERCGQWAAALAEYDKAIEANPRYDEGHLRRNALLAAHPELTEPE